MNTNTQLTRNWGIFWSGIILGIIGLIFLFYPFMAMSTASVIFGVLLCAVGVVDLVFYYVHSTEEGMNGWGLSMGIMDIALGVLFLFEPLIAAPVLPIVGGIYLVCYGVYQLIAASALMSIPGTGWIVFSGISAIICGIVFFFAPMVFVTFLAIYLVVRGIAMIGEGLSGSLPSTQTPTYSH